MPEIANVKIEDRVPIDSLEAHPENPRQSDVGAVSESVDEHGFYGTVVAQQSTRRILAGHGRIEAARARGMVDVPVAWVDVDDDEARRILLVDNRTNDLASYDDHALADLLTQLATDAERGLSGTGYDGDDLDALLHLLGTDLDLDGLHARIGDPTDEDGYRRVTLRLRPELADAVAEALRSTGVDSPAADEIVVSGWLGLP